MKEGSNRSVEGSVGFLKKKTETMVCKNCMPLALSKIIIIIIYPNENLHMPAAMLCHSRFWFQFVLTFCKHISKIFRITLLWNDLYTLESISKLNLQSKNGSYLIYLKKKKKKSLAKCKELINSKFHTQNIFKSKSPIKFALELCHLITKTTNWISKIGPCYYLCSPLTYQDLCFW